MIQGTLFALATSQIVLRKILLLRPQAALLPAVFIRSHSCFI